MWDKNSSGLGAAAFGAGALVVGMSPLPLALMLVPDGGLSETAPGLHLPSWLFGAVWTIIYPCLGVATWRIWARRTQPGATEAIAVFGLCFLFLMAFLPITAAAHEQRVTAMMDIVGLVFAYVTAWVYRRIDRGTVGWMIPLLLWMPTTTFLKLVTL